MCGLVWLVVRVWGVWGWRWMEDWRRRRVARRATATRSVKVMMMMCGSVRKSGGVYVLKGVMFGKGLCVRGGENVGDLKGEMVRVRATDGATVFFEASASEVSEGWMVEVSGVGGEEMGVNKFEKDGVMVDDIVWDGGYLIEVFGGARVFAARAYVDV